MSATSFRLLRRAMGPRWLVADGDEGEAVGYSLDLIKDAWLDRLRRGLLARFPQNGPNGETAPTDALTAMGRDRRLVRGISETDAAYALRLRRWLDDRKVAGNPFALMQKLAEYCGPLPSFRTVDARGNWFSRAADGTISVSLAQANWDWDGLAVGKRWARFWVVIYPNGLWTESAYDWGDLAGPGWGEATSGTWGSTAEADQIATIKHIVNDWKPGGTRCVNIILAFDPTSFDPAGAPHAAGLPDGLWQRGSKTVDGVRVPSRLSTARYWDGA